MTLKTENQFYAFIIELINSLFITSNITGWQVLQLRQPVKLTEIKPTVYVTATNADRLGWQKRKYIYSPETDLQMEEKFKQAIDVQISALRTRKLTDTTETISSTDILEIIRAYLLNLNTIEKIKQSGYSIFQPTQIEKPEFINDSENFEIMPFFNVTFIQEQTLISAQTAISEYKQIIERIN